MRRHGTYRERAVVLRHSDMGEADRLITLFTMNEGKIRVVAKGARRSRSGSGARLDLFNVIDAQFFAGRELDGVTQAVTAERFPNIALHLDRFAAASAIADAVMKTTPDRERNIGVFNLTVDAFRHLNAGTHTPFVVAYYALARLMDIAGHAPVLGVCASCGSRDVVKFSFSAGGTMCQEHSTGADPVISSAAVDVWRSFSAGFDACADTEAKPVREVAGVMLAFASWQFDTRIRSFQMLDGVSA